MREGLRAALEHEQRRLEAENNRVRLTGAEYFALRKQVRIDVEAYLLEHGPEGLTDEIVSQWVNEASKRCLTNMVESIVENDPPSPEILARARERLQARLGERPTLREQQARANGTYETARHLPAAPSPSYLAQNGIKELEKLDIIVEIHKLFADANLLRSAGIRTDPSGQEKVINARVFDKSIARRLEILATSINTQKELWDLQRMENFYNTIIEVIASAAPEIAQEIQRRLAQLNIRIGMA